jgi:beta-RFAP synthase
MSVRVVAPCRLHFGLFHVPVEGLTHWPDGRPIRKFGGVGLMIENPNVTVEVRPSTAESWDGPLGDRGFRFARGVLANRYDGGRATVAVIADGPTEHTGLGVGTALGLAAGYSAFRLGGTRGYSPGCSLNSYAVRSIASWTGRGQRSAIGVYGFERGGLIVDGGKEPGETLSRLESRIDFPERWRAVLVRPDTEPVWHGDAERAAFGRDRTPEQALATTKRLYTIARSQLVRAVQDEDFDAFAAAVFEYNRTAGEPFAVDQGGPYAGPAVSGVIDELLSWGVQGVGQSSWGPTVFAFARDPDEAEHIARRARDWLPASADVTVTAANNTGARLEMSGEPRPQGSG